MNTAPGIKKGVFYLAAEKGLNGTVAILLIPVMIQNIGVESYGFWGILLGLVAYALCLDLGISSSTERFVAYYAAKGDTRALSEYISTAVLLLVILSLLLIVPMVAFGEPVIAFLTKGSLPVDGRSVVLLLYPAIMANWAVFVFAGVVKGLQRFDISSKIQISTKLLFAAAVVVLLTKNKTVFALLYAFNLQCFMQVVCFFFFARRLLPKVSFFRFSLSRPMMKQMLNFGFKIQISALSLQVNQQFDKFLLASFGNLVLVGYYDAASRIVYAIKDIPLFLFSAMIPRVSALAAGGNRKEIQDLFYRVTSFLAIAGFSIIGLLVLNSEILIGFVLKNEINLFSIMVFNVLCITMVWQSMAAGAAYVARGMGMTQIEMKTALIVLVINVVASYGFIRLFNVKGVVFGTALSSVIAPVVCYVMVCREFSCRFLPFMYRLFFVPLIGFVLSGAVCWTMKVHLFTSTAWWINVLASSIVFIGLSHLFYRFFRYQPYLELIELAGAYKRSLLHG